MKNTKYISALGLGILALNSCSQKEAQRPNILFIMSDDHSRAAVSAYEGINADLAPTPNIDAIGHNGAIMQNMICTNAISGPSRASLITGKFSTTNGFYQNEGGIVFDNTQQQYQMILRDHGYTTGLFGKWHLMSEPNGFDHYMIHANQGQQGTYWNPVMSIDGKKKTVKGYATTITADAALEWLDDVKKGDKPFCMMLHFKAPHRPWEPDSCYLHLYDDVHFPHPATFDDDYAGREQTLGQNMATIEGHLSRKDLKQVPPANLNKQQTRQWLNYGGSGDNQFWTPDSTLQGAELKDWKFQKYIKDYLRVIRSVDDQVGRVIKYLKDNDMYENTIIVYMGDQGFFLGEHGIYDKRWMYEEAIQMPCLISYPGVIKKGQYPKEVAMNVDIAPTLLDLAGIDIPEDMQGTSMKGILTGDKDAVKNWDNTAYYQYFEYPKWHKVQPHYGLRTERYKLIHFYYNVDLWEFYDLEKDPMEMHNAIADPEYAQIIDSLKVELRARQKEYGDDIPLDQRREMTDRYMINYDGK